jgi:hypothetical protein
MMKNSKSITAVVMPLLAFTLLSMSFGNAYAHTMEVVGDYKIEIGWDEEPPIQGIENAIEIVVTHATDEDKKQAEEEDAMMDMAHDETTSHEEDMAHDETTSHEEDMAHDETTSHEEDHDHEEGISGLEDAIQVTVTLDGQTSTINLIETEVGGIYQGKFIPSSPGHPVVHLSGTIHETEVDLDMHPEAVESLSILPPLKQISHGIDPSDVQCKEGLNLFMRTHEDSAICASSDLGQRLMELGVVDFF